MSAVTVYGATWCHDTQDTLRHLKQVNVQFTYHDVDEDPAAAAFVLEHNAGKQKLPTVDVGGKILSIPDDADLDAALRRGGIV